MSTKSKLAYVTGSKGIGYTLQFKSLNPGNRAELIARAEYAELFGTRYTVFRAAQNIANAINAFVQELGK